MVEEAEQEIGPSSQSRESAIGWLADLLIGLGRGVPHPLLDVPMTTFLRVQLRGIRRQPLYVDLGVLRQERLDRRRTMRLQSIPDDDHRATDLPAEVLQVNDRVLAVDRVVKVLLVDPSGQRQSDRRGDLAPLAHAPQDGRLPLGCPRRTGPELVREPRLIDEDDHGALVASLFLMRGQSRSSQARISSSSRSRARTAGLWAVQPKSLSRTER